MSERIGVAIIGSGNIGTDLMIKIKRTSPTLEVLAMVGIDPASDGLARARRLGVTTTSDGVDGLVALSEFDGVRIVLDATSAAAHKANAAVLTPLGRLLVDLTPAALGPFVVPAVNFAEHVEAPNVNMVTCGGQATIPVVAAITQITDVPYAEIIASVASRGAGPGTRANIDEFTETTSHAIEQVGGAYRGKAIIILNPADPPVIMRDTVLALIAGGSSTDLQDQIRTSIDQMVAEVSHYVPGYRMVQKVQFTPVDPDEVATVMPTNGGPVDTKVAVFLEVEGAAHYLPAYAGNLDIMTSAAMRVAERMAERMAEQEIAL